MRKLLSADRVRDLLRDGLTVADLIEELSMCNPEAIVAFRDPYGDRGETMQVLPVGEVEEMEAPAYLYETAYSESRLAVGEIEDCDCGSDEEQAVLLEQAEAAADEVPVVFLF